LELPFVATVPEQTSVLTIIQLDAIKDEYLAVLTNWELLAFNQDDQWGASAIPYKWGLNPDWTWNMTHPAEFYSGGSSRGIHTFIMNTLNETVTKTAKYDEIPGLSAKKTYEVRDMWTHEKLGSFRGKYTFELKARDTAALLFTEKGGKHPYPHPGALPLPKIYNTKPKRWLPTAIDF
jgi:alpha-galactosidase